MYKIPNLINEVLGAYFRSIDSKLPNWLEAYYLYGSVTLEAYKEGHSDIDFLGVTRREATEREILMLQDIHKELQRKYPRAILDGRYVAKDAFVHAQHEIPSFRFNEGKLLGIQTFDKNSIDAFQLRTYGITIRGPDIRAVDGTVHRDHLPEQMRRNLNTYWLDWVKDCKRPLSVKSIGLFVSLSMIEWGVLGVSRLYYTIKEQDIVSKVGAGEYALRNVPPRWHKILHESMRLRKGQRRPLYRSVRERRKDAIGYMEFIIKEGNRLVEYRR